jgi:hypothetical protein
MPLERKQLALITETKVWKTMEHEEGGSPCLRIETINGRLTDARRASPATCLEASVIVG